MVGLFGGKRHHSASIRWSRLEQGLSDDGLVQVVPPDHPSAHQWYVFQVQLLLLFLTIPDLGDALTYLDLLVHLLIRMSRAESTGGSPTATQLALRLQSIALEALQILVSKGDVSQPSLATIRLHLVDKLSAAIHRRQNTLQSKMLHLLHAAMSASDTPQRHHRSASVPEKSDAISTDPESDFEAAVVSVIVEGVSSASNQPILQHWIDFVLMTSSHLSRRGELLESLNTCFASQLRSVMSKLKNVYDQSPVSDLRTSTSEAEPIMLLNALERVVMLLASLQTSRRSEDGSRQGNEGGSMILGLVSGVFGADGSSSSEIVSVPFPSALGDHDQRSCQTEARECSIS
jgi:hypothetical protein